MEQRATVADGQGCHLPIPGPITSEIFPLDNGLRSAMFNIAGQALREVARSGCVPTALEANMRRFI